MPPQIAMVGSARRESARELNVELAVYRMEFDAGESDSRLTGENEFGSYKVRQFFPGSACGVIVTDEKKIEAAEPGLQNFTGKSVMTITTADNPGEIILVVWESEIETAAEIDNDEFRYMLQKIRALSWAFT